MDVGSLSRRLELRRLTPATPRVDARPVTNGYSSDLMSDVLSHARENSVLVTAQSHRNVVAVAARNRLSAVIFAHGREPEALVCAKAAEEDIALFVSDETVFDVAGRLYGLGLKSNHA